MIKRLVIELDIDVHKSLKIKAIENDTTMADYIRNLIKQDLQKEQEGK